LLIERPALCLGAVAIIEIDGGNAAIALIQD
jgi:hypothetical protein